MSYLVAVMFSPFFAFSSANHLDFSLLEPPHKIENELSSMKSSSSPLEWKPIVFFEKKTPKFFKHKLYSKPLYSYPLLNEKAIEKFISYFDFSDIHAFDFLELEDFLSKRFELSPDNLYLFKFLFNLEFAYKTLKNIDLLNEGRTQYHYEAIRYYLSHIQKHNLKRKDPIIDDFLEEITRRVYSESIFNDILKVISAKKNEDLNALLAYGLSFEDPLLLHRTPFLESFIKIYNDQDINLDAPQVDLFEFLVLRQIHIYEDILKKESDYFVKRMISNKISELAKKFTIFITSQSTHTPKRILKIYNQYVHKYHEDGAKEVEQAFAIENALENVKINSREIKFYLESFSISGLDESVEIKIEDAVIKFINRKDIFQTDLESKRRKFMNVLLFRKKNSDQSMKALEVKVLRSSEKIHQIKEEILKLAINGKDNFFDAVLFANPVKLNDDTSHLYELREFRKGTIILPSSKSQNVSCESLFL